MKINQKLIKVCSSLGINLLEISKFIQISELPDIAAWGYDKKTKENFIFINPKILKFPIEYIHIILKHEILHYAGYKEIEGAKNKELVNIVLDVVINKILTTSKKNVMKKLCRRIYPEESKQNIICLARPDLSVDDVPEQLKNLWEEIWNKEEIPSPSALYYRLVLHTNSDRKFIFKIVRASPFSSKKDGEIVLREVPEERRGNRNDNKFEKVSVNILNNISFSVSKTFSHQLSKIFSKLLVGKEKFNLENVREFIQRLKTREQMEDTSRKIVNSLVTSSKLQVYPYELSRLGIIYLACGVSKIFPLYWNKFPESRKPKLAVYIDTSPSMDIYKEMEVFLVDELRDYLPIKIFLFAGDIKETCVEEFTSGDYEQGYSTDFDAPIKHLLESEFDAGIIFTDGYSSVSSENMKKLKESKKRLFTVYFTENGKPSSDLDGLSEEVMVIRK